MSGGDHKPADSLARRLDLLASLRGYKAAWLPTDIGAGLAIAAVGLPSAIAYPAIAGLPAETGIYASIASVLAYAVFGPSRRLIVGPDAATVTLMASVMGAAIGASAGGDARVAVAAALAIVVGAICVLARLLKFGSIASFLSRPILIGFFAGVALSILVGQLGKITGLKIDAPGPVSSLIELFSKVDAIHWPSLILAVAMFAVLMAAPRLKSPVPGPVIVVVLATLLSWLFGFEAMGMRVVGALPEGLPSLALPDFSSLSIPDFLMGAGAVFLVSFGAGIITARSFGEITGEEVDPNRELAGFGAANVASGLLGGFPVTASDSRTAVNLSVGGRTQLAGVFSAIALSAAMLFFSDLLRLVPLPALGAILVAAALGLIDLKDLREVWRISPIEFVFAIIAMVGAIGFGVLQGVIIAIFGTLAHVVLNGMHPRVVLLGRLPNQAGFYKMHRSERVQPIPGMTIVLIQDSLLFYSVDHVKARLAEIRANLAPGTRWLVLDGSALAQIDVTAAAMLQEFHRSLEADGIRLAVAELSSEATALLRRAELIDEIGETMFFDDLEDAVRAFEAEQNG